jgi:ubiquinone/menaquinone biosynthesis C-methylase UbiE
VFDVDASEDLESWYTRYFESDDYEEFNLEVLGPQVSVEQVSRLLHWLELRPPQRVLDLCCGAGRHARELARRGFTVIAMDRSPYQLHKAQMRANGLQQRAAVRAAPPLLCRADARQLPIQDRSVDAVVCLFNSFGYFSEEGNRAVLAEVARVLLPGGKLWLDVLNRDAFLYHQPERTWDRVQSGLVLQEMEVLVRTSQLRTNWTYLRDDGRREDLTTLNRLYSPHELVAMCEAVGLEVMDLNDAQVWGYFSWRNSHSLAVVARRRTA